jgi:hypothetical protein
MNKGFEDSVIQSMEGTMRKVLLLVLIALLATPLVGSAQKGGTFYSLTKRLKRYGDAANVKPGAWAAYRVQASEEEGAPKTLKVACVGTEEVNGQKGMWLEVETDMPESDVGEASQMKVIMKSLIVGDPGEKQSVRKMIMQAGNRPPMLMNVSTEAGEEETEFPEVKEVGTETITVPAGTFTCRHLQGTTDKGETGDLYISEKVALFGMVKLSSPEGGMELLDHGASGAVSQIKGEPMPIPDMQQMMQRNMKDATRKSEEEPEDKE